MTRHLNRIFFVLAYLVSISTALYSQEIVLDPVKIGSSPISLTPYFYVLENPDGKLTFAEIQDPTVASQFKRILTGEDTINLGYTRSAYWLRLTVTNPSHTSLEQIIEIGAYPITEFQFFAPSGEKKYQSISTGSNHAYSTRAYKNRFFVFPLTVAPYSSNVYYFRIQSSLSLIVPGRFWDVKSFHLHERDDYLYQALYFGIVFAMILYNFLLFVALRDKIYLLYVSFVFIGALTLASLNGLGHEFLWPNATKWANISTYVGFSTTLVALLIFMRRMLNTRTYLPIFDKLILILIGVLLLFPIGFMIDMQTYGESSAIVFGLTGAMIFCVSVYTAIKRERSAYFFLTAFSFLCLGMVMTGLGALKILPANFMTTNGMQIGSAIEMLLLAFALADRFNQVKKEKEKAQEETLKAQAKALEAEQLLVENLKSSERVLEIKVKERTAELNQSLSIIKKDLSIAKNIQQNTMLTHPSVLNDLNIVSRYFPMSEVGGDFYDISKLNDFKYRFFLADATGHGVQAAMITMAIKGVYDSLKHIALETNVLMDVFNNDFIERYISLNTYLTCIVVDLDTQHHKLKFASAGHPPALLLRESSVQLLEKTGKMIGILKNINYKSLEYAFNPGDRVYIYTDGIFEEFNSNKEEFGDVRLHSILKDNFGFSMEESIEKALTSLDRFLGEKEKQDDITILGIEYKRK
jgi:serine phosphatase RsbU (regulator of sigma subunit)